MSYKIKCSECHWHGTNDEALKAQNPFSDEPSDWIIGCPICKAIDQMERVCDEPGCRNLVSMGTPTPTVYRETCYQHAPRA